MEKVNRVQAKWKRKQAKNLFKVMQQDHLTYSTDFLLGWPNGP